MTILMWWGYSWHATFPNPPLHITSCISSLLQLHDETLFTFLSSKLQMSPGLLGWSMISSMFTEILCKADWLILMDFMFTYFEEAAIIAAATVAIMKALRTSIIASGDASHVNSFLREQQGVNIKEIVRSISFILENSPNRLIAAFPSSRTLARSMGDNEGNHYDAVRKGAGTIHISDVEGDDTAVAQASMALHAGHPIFPLPVGMFQLLCFQQDEF